MKPTPGSTLEILRVIVCPQPGQGPRSHQSFGLPSTRISPTRSSHDFSFRGDHSRSGSVTGIPQPSFELDGEPIHDPKATLVKTSLQRDGTILLDVKHPTNPMIESV